MEAHLKNKHALAVCEAIWSEDAGGNAPLEDPPEVKKTPECRGRHPVRENYPDDRHGARHGGEGDGVENVDDLHAEEEEAPAIAADI